MLTRSTEKPATIMEIRVWLRQLFSGFLGIPAETFPEEEPFFSLGLNSLTHGEVLHSLMLSFPDLSSTILFEQPNIRQLAEFLAESKPTTRGLGLATEPGVT